MAASAGAYFFCWGEVTGTESPRLSVIEEGAREGGKGKSLSTKDTSLLCFLLPRVQHLQVELIFKVHGKFSGLGVEER